MSLKAGDLVEYQGYDEVVVWRIAERGPHTPYDNARFWIVPVMATEFAWGLVDARRMRSGRQVARFDCIPANGMLVLALVSQG